MAGTVKDSQKLISQNLERRNEGKKERKCECLCTSIPVCMPSRGQCDMILQRQHRTEWTIILWLRVLLLRVMICSKWQFECFTLNPRNMSLSLLLVIQYAIFSLPAVFILTLNLPQCFSRFMWNIWVIWLLISSHSPIKKYNTTYCAYLTILNWKWKTPEMKKQNLFFQRSVLCLEYHNNRTWQELWQTDYTVSIKIIIIIQVWV